MRMKEAGATQKEGCKGPFVITFIREGEVQEGDFKDQWEGHRAKDQREDPSLIGGTRHLFTS